MKIPSNVHVFYANWFPNILNPVHILLVHLTRSLHQLFWLPHSLKRRLFPSSRGYSPLTGVAPLWNTRYGSGFVTLLISILVALLVCQIPRLGLNGVCAPKNILSSLSDCMPLIIVISANPWCIVFNRFIRFHPLFLSFKSYGAHQLVA